jgi:hypothetical protein
MGLSSGHPGEWGAPERRATGRFEATRLRGLVPFDAADDFDAADVDIADPYGTSIEDFLTCATADEMALDRPLCVVLG